MHEAFVQEKPLEVPFWHNLLVSLKIGTCLTSSWMATAGALLASAHFLDTPAQLVLGGVTIGLGMLLTNHGISLNPVPPNRPPTEVEQRLNLMFDKMAAQFKTNVRVHFLDESAMKGNWVGLQWGGNIFINKQKYDLLEPREGLVPILHEFVHALKRDNVTIVLGDIANKISLVTIPMAAIAGYVSYLSGQSPFTAALSGSIGALGAGLAYGTSKLFNNVANRIREDRADDIDLLITHDPISAISAIDKLLEHEDRNIFQKLTAAFPSREERILNVVEYFNSRWPDRAIKIIDGKVAEKPEEGTQSDALLLDATNVDHRRYVLRKDGISADPVEFGIA